MCSTASSTARLSSSFLTRKICWASSHVILVMKLPLFGIRVTRPARSNSKSASLHSRISDAQLLGKPQFDNPISGAEIARRDRLPDNLHNSMSECDRLNRRCRNVHWHSIVHSASKWAATQVRNAAGTVHAWTKLLAGPPVSTQVPPPPSLANQPFSLWRPPLLPRRSASGSLRPISSAPPAPRGPG